MARLTIPVAHKPQTRPAECLRKGALRMVATTSAAFPPPGLFSGPEKDDGLDRNARATRTKRAREVTPARPIRKPSLKAKDYLLEAAEAASAAAEPAAEAAESAVEAAAVATEAAESAVEAAAAESVEAASPPLQADRLRAAPATAAARMILRMNGIP